MKPLAFLVILIIQREVDIFKDHVWNSHRIWAQKGTEHSNAPSYIYDFPKNAVFKIKLTSFIE